MRIEPGQRDKCQEEEERETEFCSKLFLRPVLPQEFSGKLTFCLSQFALGFLWLAMERGLNDREMENLIMRIRKL